MANKAMDILSKLSLNLKPKTVLGIYGAPMTGKSVLSILIAKEYCQANNCKGIVIATEPEYDNPDYFKLIQTLSQNTLDIIRVKNYWGLINTLQKSQGCFIVFDSVSAVSDVLIQSFNLYQAEPRVVASRVNPSIRQACRLFRDVVNTKSATGIIISQSVSTVGTTLYRSLLNERPGVPIRCDHYIDYEIHLGFGEGDNLSRVITIIANRLDPWSEGKKVEFRWEKGGIVIKSEVGGEIK